VLPDPSQVTHGVAWHRTIISAACDKLTNRLGYGMAKSKDNGKLDEDQKKIHKIKEGASTNHVIYE
jgi:hypothetical protein